MKKFLHGRRHLRARASARAGRLKRRMHRQARLYNVELPALVWRLVEVVDIGLASFAKYAKAMGSMPVPFTDSLREAIKKLNSEDQQGVIINELSKIQ